MSTDLKQYRENARERNLCEEYTKIWDSRKTLKQVFDMAMSSKGVDYLCASIAENWGISPEIIAEKFSPFVNNGHISEQNGYNSMMYCLYNGIIDARSTVLAIISSDVIVDIPETNICEIYAVCKCRIELRGKGRCVVVCYGDENDVEIVGSCGNMKRIQKKERDSYGD